MNGLTPASLNAARIAGSDSEVRISKANAIADGAPEALGFVRKLNEITPPAAAFDAAFSTK